MEELKIIITKKLGESPKIEIKPIVNKELFKLKMGKMGDALMIHIEDGIAITKHTKNYIDEEENT